MARRIVKQKSVEPRIALSLKRFSHNLHMFGDADFLPPHPGLRMPRSGPRLGVAEALQEFIGGAGAWACARSASARAFSYSLGWK